MSAIQLDLGVVAVANLDGVEMGVLEDGSSFLTGRGLAAVAGVAPSVINQWAGEYTERSTKKRDRAIRKLLSQTGYSGPLFYKTQHAGQTVNAFPEPVCMAVLEYYAWEADRRSSQAMDNFRLLARAGMRAFVYTSLGYDPTASAEDPFTSYHQRLLLNPMPRGFFSVFSETAHIVLTSIRAGLKVDQHTVPDISVGQAWSTYWKNEELDQVFGPRKKHPHTYPDSYAQSAATPEAWVYPVEALGTFRTWLDAEYLPSKYPAYLNRKVKLGALPASRAELIIGAVTDEQLPSTSA